MSKKSNFRRPFHKQHGKCRNTTEFSKCSSNVEHFFKKNATLIAYVFSKIQTSKDVVR